VTGARRHLIMIGVDIWLCHETCHPHGRQ